MEIIRNIFRRKMRTFLTVFGIVIGVFALVAMGGIAEKTNQLFRGGISYLKNNISVSPKGTAGGLFALSVYPDTVAARVRKVPGVKAVTATVGLLFDEEPPVVSTSVPDIILGVNKKEMIAADKYIDPAIRIRFADGDWWKDGQRGVAIMGVDLAKKKKVRVGDTVKNRGKSFQITGIMSRTGTTPDSSMYIPLEDGRELLEKTQPILKSAQEKNYVNSVYAVAKLEEADRVADRIAKELPDMKVIAPQKAIADMNKGSTVLNLVTVGSTMIALLVGGLSVINTMLMSVSERTREIGLKKAVGAENSDIMKEYLAESTVLGVLAGLIGLGLGSAFIYGVNSVTAKTGNTIFLLTPRLAVGSLLFALFIGVVAGIYPAYRAARLDPIQALKNE